MTEAVIIYKPVHSFALQINGMDWFLFDNGLRHERVNAWIIREMIRLRMQHFQGIIFI